MLPGREALVTFYQIQLVDKDGIQLTEAPGGGLTTLHFQNGPIKEVGVCGISNESLLTVVIDRMRGFQSGESSCRENEHALFHLESAMMWLQKRTRDRLNRGVEGTNAK